MKILRMTSVLAFCLILTLGLTGCGGGSGGSGSPGTSASSNSGSVTGGNQNPFIPPSQSTSGGGTSSSSSQGGSGSVGDLGLVLVPSDPPDNVNNGITNSPSILQIVHIYDSNGKVLATPTITTLNYPGENDFDGAALTSSGSEGVIIDGYNNNLYYFSIKNGDVSTANMLNADYGVDGDSVAILSNGDEAVVSLDNSDYLVLVSGILSGHPLVASPILTPGYRDGVVISNDDKVLLARGGNGLTVYSITSIDPQPGQYGGTVSHSFAKIQDIPSLGTLSADGEGRDGMAISPLDSSRAVIIVNGASATGSTVNLLTGLPGVPALSNSISVNHEVDTVAISPDGDLAIVGTDKGLLMFSGVASGALTQVGQLYSPSYTVNNASMTLGKITTLGFTVDGKYVVVCDYTNSSLLVIPVSASGFGEPAGILGGISVPWSDTMLVH